MNSNKPARKFKRNDIVVLFGTKYRVTFLNLRFGGKKKFDRVTVHAHRVDDSRSHLNINLPAHELFNVTRKKK